MPALGAIVFGDDAARADLEAITHPAICRARHRAWRPTVPDDGVVVHDHPLLVEMGMAAFCDLVVVVDVPEDVQVERLVSLRGMTEADARARMAAQASREERLAEADVVLENTGSIADLEARVDELWAEQVTSLRQTNPPRSGEGGTGSNQEAGYAARSGSAMRRSVMSAWRSSWRTRSAEMPWRLPMSASFCWRPSSRP